MPDAASNQKFNETARVKLWAHIDDKTGNNQLLNESVLFDGTLTTTNSNSSASFVRDLRANERIRLIHENKNEIDTEILMKVSAIR